MISTKSACISLLAFAVVLSGCATKRYGRLQPLTAAESQVYSCRDIEVEIAKVEAFRQQVSEGAKINGASVLGFLGDWGIGNANEKGAAERTATQRMNELLALRAQKSCGVQLAPKAEPAPPSPTQTEAFEASPVTERRNEFGDGRVRCVTCK